MKKIKKMEADHLYMIRGASVSNSAFFEREDDCKLFLELADHYLGEYMSVTSFQNNRDGWVMMIVTKSAETIKSAYAARRAASKKCKEEFTFKEIWQMLSDQIRIFLSTYVKKTNSQTGRSGAKVRRRYERFVFENEAEAKKMSEQLASTCYDQAQSMEQYRPSDDSHELSDEMIQTSLYMSCALLTVPEKLAALGLGILDLGVFWRDVARQLIKTTFDHHFPP